HGGVSARRRSSAPSVSLLTPMVMRPWRSRTVMLPDLRAEICRPIFASVASGRCRPPSAHYNPANGCASKLSRERRGAKKRMEIKREVKARWRSTSRGGWGLLPVRYLGGTSASDEPAIRHEAGVHGLILRYHTRGKGVNANHR